MDDQSSEADTDSPVSTSDSQDDTCRFLDRQDTVKERSTNPFESLSPLEKPSDVIDQISSAMEETGLDYPMGAGARPKVKEGGAEPGDEASKDLPSNEDAEEDEEEVMASSVVCTDGSDVEALTDDRDFSDVEVLDTVKNSDEEENNSSDGELNKTQKNKEFSENDTSIPNVQPGLNGVNGSGNSPSSLPLEAGADVANVFGVGECDSPFDADDEITPVAQGYDFMTDLDIANGAILRPDSLSLPRPLQHRYRQKLARSESESSSWSDIYSHHGSTEALLETSNTPLHAQGTLIKEGDQIAFVAGDLTEKIKRSSPLTKAELDERWLHCRTPSSRSISSINSMSSSASGWSNSSASGWSAFSHTSGGMSRSSSILTGSPEEIPPVDPRALADLENHAYRVGANLMHMLTTLKTNLHKMSALTGACVETYKESIDNTCDSVDGAIKSMYALMAKCEELSKTMRPVHQLADQIKKIKRILDLFEAQLAEEEKREMLAKTPKK